MVIIAVHELGHFLFAKNFDVEVSNFSIGFGPSIFSKKIGETKYAISLIPLGGYVKMVGELDDESGNNPRSYNSKPRWQRILILLAGPGFNFIFGTILVFLSFGVFGIPFPTSKITDIEKDSPAAVAGLKEDDKILEIDGIKVASSAEVIDAISSKKLGGKINLKEARNGLNLNIEVAPGLSSGRPRIGVSFGEMIRIKNFSKSILAGTNYTVFAISGISNGIYSILTGQIALGNSISGPVTIVNTGSQIKSSGGWADLLLFVALLNFNLGLINLLPIPILDGGNIATLLVESAIRRPLNQGVKVGLQFVGLALLLGIMIFATYNDISRLLKK